jgi:hypothetical protein
MKKIIVGFFLFTCVLSLMAQDQDSVKIYGYVTDFDNRPLDRVSVRIKNKNFENIYETLTDVNGHYSLNVLKDTYYCLYAIKPSDYGKTKLEYWAWNVPAYNDLKIDPQYERMELYGLNVFEPQVGPWNTYMIYFRPMSLTKGLALRESGEVSQDTIDIAPKSIKKDELTISINDKICEVVSINKILEYARDAYMYGYLVQVKKPDKPTKSKERYDKITIILKSVKTGDTGKAECFFKIIE